MERDVILKGRKWTEIASQIGDDVVKAIKAATETTDGDALVQVVKQRYQKFVALAPDNIALSPTKTNTVLDGRHVNEIRDALSPLSTSRASVLKYPTKKGLVDYEKHMTGMESSIQKAMKLCNDHAEKNRIELAKQQAKRQRLEKQREREAKRSEKALHKAQQEGVSEADKAVMASGEQVDEYGGDAEEDEGAWPIVQRCDDIIRTPLGRCVRT